MSLKKLTILVSLISFATCLRLILAFPDNNLKYIQCEVGQGDAVLITQSLKQILIDAGPNDGAVTCLNQYVPFFDKQIDILVLSHLDKDHSGGALGVLKQYRVKEIVWNGLEPDNQTWQEIQREAVKQGIKIIVSTEYKGLKIGQVQLDFLWPTTDMALMTSQIKSLTGKQSQDSSDNNRFSIISRLRFDDFTALLMADVPASEEPDLVKQYPGQLISTVLKVGHHGSKLSTSSRLIQEVRPALATIGVGKNTYGHPDPEILKRLSDYKVQTFRTDLDHSIVITTDGKHWWQE